jgi:integrase
MSDWRYAQSTVNGVLSAVRDLFRHDVANNPTDSSLVKSAKKAAAKCAPPVRTRDPLTRAHLLRIMKDRHLDTSPGFTRDFFMTLLAYRSFLRGGEIVNLLFTDIFISKCTLEEEAVAHFPAAMLGVELLFIRVSSSKTNPQSQKPDRERSGDTVIIGPDSNTFLDPLHWFRRWSHVRNKQSAYLFHSAFNSNAPRPLAQPRFNEAVKKLAASVGLSADYYLTGHSTRAGGATDAIRAGVDLMLVKRHGRWKSDAVYLYIRDDVPSSLTISAALGHMHPPGISSRSSAAKPASTVPKIVSIEPATLAAVFRTQTVVPRPVARIDPDNDPFPPRLRTYGRASIAVDVPSPVVNVTTHGTPQSASHAP